MGQKAQLWWDLPAIEAFDLLRALYQIPNDVYRKRLDELTELLDVTRLLNTQIRRLSLGERMKMEVIGAIIHLPKVIFLDEPTIGLDVLAAQKLREFLKLHNQREGATIILTSHNMDDISELCKRIILIKEGSSLFDGDPKKLANQDECVLRIKLLAEATAAEIAGAVDLNEAAVLKDEEDPTTYFLTVSRTRVAEYLQKLLGKFQIALHWYSRGVSRKSDPEDLSAMMDSIVVPDSKSTYFSWAVQWRLAAVKNGIRDALAYRGDFLIDFFTSALVPVSIQLILWYSIFHKGGATSFAGMTYPELLAYTWTSILFSQIRGGDYDFSLIEMIRTGSLSNYLLRPLE